MKTRALPDGLYAAWRKGLKLSLVVLLGYLVQVVVVPHVQIGTAVPHVIMVTIAIITVSFGKKYAFISGAVFGIMMESMSRRVPLMHLIIYPALGLLCAQVFADMSDIKREQLRINLAERRGSQTPGVPGIRRRPLKQYFQRQTADDLNAHVRILLNALMLTGLYELIMVIYITLNGAPMTFAHILRIVNTLLYTAVWCVLMFPTRAFLGMYKRRRRKVILDEIAQETLDTTESALSEVALIPDVTDKDFDKPAKPLSFFERRRLKKQTAGQAAEEAKASPETAEEVKPTEPSDKPRAEDASSQTVSVKTDAETTASPDAGESGQKDH